MMKKSEVKTVLIYQELLDLILLTILVRGVWIKDSKALSLAHLKRILSPTDILKKSTIYNILQEALKNKYVKKIAITRKVVVYAITEEGINKLRKSSLIEIAELEKEGEEVLRKALESYMKAWNINRKFLDDIWIMIKIGKNMLRKRS